jgi:hypothetical protein
VTCISFAAFAITARQAAESAAPAPGGSLELTGAV